MVSFIVSVIVTAILIAIVVRVARRRKPGTPLTWGEAYLAGTFMFGLMLMIYGVVPDRWLRFADGDLRWRSDKIGIPVGGLGVGSWHLFKKPYLLFPHGVTIFGRGRIIITAQVLRDAVAAGIYVVFLIVQVLAWLWWQNRGKKPAQPAIETSAYGRPLLKRADASATASAEA
jgi:hypothetical protein